MLQQGDIIYRFEIKIDFKKNIISTDSKELKVLDSNEKIFVLKDSQFTRIQYKIEKNPLNSCFKKVTIHRFDFQPYYDELNGFMFTQYPSKKIAYKAIKRELRKWMYEKYGKYCKGVDLLNTIDF
jgi:hypothetical protein